MFYISFYKIINMKRKLILGVNFILLLIFVPSTLQAICLDTLKKNIHLELSFGASKLFIPNADESNLQNHDLSVIPTSAMLFYAEFFTHYKIRVPIFFNLPTETKKFLVNGQLINEDASSSFGTGLEFRMFRFKLDSKTLVEMEAGPLVSYIIEKPSGTFAPLVAGRIKLLRSDSFVMYIGSSYTPFINVWGIFYGTGATF